MTSINLKPQASCSSNDAPRGADIPVCHRSAVTNPQLAICLSALLLATSVSVAFAKEAAPSKEPAAAGDTALFDRLDTNHNDAIAAEEVTAENRPIFERLIRRGDTDHDHVLSRKEFLAALTPTRPAKPIETQESSLLPQANAVLYVLLTMDTNRDARIEKDEVPSDLKPAFEMMADRLDKNGNGAIERQELSRGGPAMSAVAGRYCERQGIDADAELAKLKKSQGEAFDRFERQPVPLDQLRDPKQARQLFAQFDENADGKLDPKEVPDPLQEPIKRLVRLGDRDDDGQLNEQEFVSATELVSKSLKRRQSDEMPVVKPKSKADRKAKAAAALSDAKK